MTAARRSARAYLVVTFQVLLGLLTSIAPAAAGTRGSPFHLALRQGLDEGRYDRVTAAFHTYCAVRAPELLPEELREARARTEGICATPALVVLEREAEALPPESRRLLEELRIRPPSLFHLQSSILPLRVHFDLPGQAELAAEFLARFEETWLIEVGDMGFTSPPSDYGIGGSDDFDVYLDGSMGPGDGYSDADVPVAETWWYDMTSFVVISANTGEPSRSALVAHEFNHSCQWAMDAAEDDAFYENTSCLVEDCVYDDVNDIYWYLPMFQDYPHRSIDYFGELYQYGAFPWQVMLCEAYGDGSPGLIRDLWNLSRQASATNEPDYLDALDTVMMPSFGTDLRGLYTRFAQWRWFTGENDDGHHFLEHYPEPVLIERVVYPHQLPTGFFGAVHAPAEFGANYTLFETGAPGDLRVTLSAPAGLGWSLTLMGLPASGDPPEVVEVPVTAGQGQGRVVHWERFERVVLVVCNLGDGDHDPDADDWVTTSYALSADLLPPSSSVAEAPDAGPRLRLVGPHPSAGRPTMLRLRLDDGETGVVTVYDASGRCVRTLRTGRGPHDGVLVWDGADDEGRELPAGLYAVRLRSDAGGDETVRIARLK